MVKKQREKLYQSSREHRATAQDRAGTAVSANVGTVQRRLPFSHCALSLAAYEHPVCNRRGILFESTAITPFVLKNKIDPVSGDPLETKDLIQLNMDKDEEGRWQCPVLTKPFSDHTKIVAVLQPGGREANVFSWEAYHELNVKPGNYEDLISGAKFHKKKDTLVLFDPGDDAFNALRDINQFYHVRHARELNSTNPNASSGSVNHSVTASRILDKLQKKKQQQQQQQQQAEAAAASKKRKADSLTTPGAAPASYTTYYDRDGSTPLAVLAHDVTGVEYTQGGATQSLTSTAVAAVSDNRQRAATREEILRRQLAVMRTTALRTKKKGYVRLRTSRGDLTLELHCDVVPRTCANFLGLCAAGKYDNTVFHRLIPNFMIQGGKPVDDAEEEECLWGGTMVDEFDDRLKHTGNVISMANAGPNTNKRQFFLCFRSAPHLDKKHSVFGTVIDGRDRLVKLEKIPTDKKERPREEIKILGTDVLVDPYREAREMEQKRLQKVVAKRNKSVTATADSAAATKQTTSAAAAAAAAAALQQKNQVGRYLKKPAAAQKPQDDNDDDGKDDTTTAAIPSRLPPPPKKTTFGNFSGW